MLFHASKSLKDKKKLIVFSHTEKTKKSKICCSMHFGFNNKFIKATRTKPVFKKKHPKNIFFSFSIWDYKFICKTYSRY